MAVQVESGALFRARWAFVALGVASRPFRLAIEWQIAATVAELVGEDYRAFSRAAAPSLLEAMSKR
jgi:hypothetical protein